MQYDQFIKRLNKGIEGRIRGYFEEGDGCRLYMSRDDTIYVPAPYIHSHEEELSELLRDFIREGVQGAYTVTLVEDALSLQPCVDEDPAEVSN